MSIDWSSDDNAWFPYFAIGGNYLCENIPECVANSENFNISLDQFYYSFQIDSPQECESVLIENPDLNPSQFSLSNPYPNPFNPVTNIAFDLPEASEVILEIYNISGQRVRTLVNKQYQAGRHMVQWSATNDFGQSVASGMYLYLIQK